MAEENITYRVIPPCSAEQDNLLTLLARCFPNAWGKRAPGSPFPYAGTSFVAEAGGHFIGHAAIMHMKSEVAGQVLDVGGLASVGVDPDWRGRGIAEKLCRMAEAYFGERNYAMLSLYTALYRVYEKSGWRRYDNAEKPWTLAGNGEKLIPGVAGADLDETARERVLAANASGAKFPGKTVRYEGPKVRHSWKNLFARGNLRCYLAPGGYAVTCHGILEELFALGSERKALLASVLADNAGEVTVAVPPECLSRDEAAGYGFAVSGEAKQDPMAGESPMIYTYNDGRFPELAKALAEKRLYFPAIDKF